MREVKLLDCTLRDGGYVNNWHFGKNAIRDILFNLSKAGMDIIECGFLTDKPYQPDDSIFSSPQQINALLPSGSKSMFVAMIAIGEKEMDPALLPPAQEYGLSGIRLTFHSDEIEKALRYGRIIQEKGYRLFMQPVGSSFYPDEQLIDLILKVNQLHPYAFYIVDTLGTMYQRDLQRQLYLADYNLEKGICIGFHSHNNLQMAFANAQHLLDYKTDRTILIDCSANGMGRGAGNLCSELIMDYINQTTPGRYDTLPLLELVDQYLSSVYVSSPWGYSYVYFLSAANGCHPNYASYLLSQQTLHVNTIGEILEQIPQGSRKRFDKDLIKSIYQSFQKNAVDDTQLTDHFRKLFHNKTVLAVAPGKTVATENQKIRDYIAKHDPFVICINFIPESIRADLFFVTSVKRYEMLENRLEDQKTVLTSNVPANQKFTQIINYAPLTNTSSYASDSAGTMLLKWLVKCSVKQVALAGFDGFDAGASNYVEEKYNAFITKEALEQKNREIQLQLEKRAQDLDIQMITSSLYSIENQRERQ